MDGIVIRYAYDGDEAVWQRVVDGFLAAIAADPDVQGRFRYVAPLSVILGLDPRTQRRTCRAERDAFLGPPVKPEDDSGGLEEMTVGSYPGLCRRHAGGDPLPRLWRDRLSAGLHYLAAKLC